VTPLCDLRFNVVAHLASACLRLVYLLRDGVHVEIVRYRIEMDMVRRGHRKNAREI